MADSRLEARLTGTPRTRFFLELFGNSAQFPISNSLLELFSARLKTYSEWLLGQQLLTRLMEDPASLSLRRQERAVLFMDIRGFTAWSEKSAPETVVQMLNRYYHVAETVLLAEGAIKFKFAADEVLGVFENAQRAARAAQSLRAKAQPLLAEFGLSAGIGLHAGALVEGLLGSMGMKFYDVIGDTVNTAKRIESAAGGGEVLMSETLRRQLDPATACGAVREIQVKGKEQPLRVFPLEPELR